MTGPYSISDVGIDVRNVSVEVTFQNGTGNDPKRCEGSYS